jgi:hypothetical protein
VIGKQHTLATSSRWSFWGCILAIVDVSKQTREGVDRGAGPLQHFLEIDTGPAEGFQAKKHHDGLVKKYHGSQSVISRSLIVTDDSSHFLWKSECHSSFVHRCG